MLSSPEQLVEGHSRHGHLRVLLAEIDAVGLGKVS